MPASRCSNPGSNHSYNFDRSKYVDLSSDQDIKGVKTFERIKSQIVPIEKLDLVNKEYADSLIMSGPKGDKGDTGLQGIQGVKGDTGSQGIQGIKGDKGNAGDTGLTGSQGIQGITGSKGDKGDIGPRGFAGLQGDKGEQGDTGPQGQDGLSNGEAGGDLEGNYPNPKIINGYVDLKSDQNINGIKTINLLNSSVIEFNQVKEGGDCNHNTARLYAKDVGGTAELFVKDEAGNETQISPHAINSYLEAGGELLSKEQDPFPYIIHEKNEIIGKERWLYISKFMIMTLNGKNPSKDCVITKDLLDHEKSNWDSKKSKPAWMDRVTKEKVKEVKVIKVPESRMSKAKNWLFNKLNLKK